MGTDQNQIYSGGAHHGLPMITAKNETALLILQMKWSARHRLIQLSNVLSERGIFSSNCIGYNEGELKVMIHCMAANFLDLPEDIDGFLKRAA